MKTRLLLSVIFSISYLGVMAQCNLPFPPSNTCETAPIICPLDGYCSSAYDGANSADQPSTFCGSIQNNNWIAFIPSTTSLTIDLIVGNCPGTGAGTGIQAQVFAVCGDPWTSASNCIYEASPNTKEEINLPNLIIGDIYYFMTDGYSGDVCNFTLSVTSGSTQPSGGDTLIADAGADVLFDCLTQEVTLDGSNSFYGSNDSIAWLNDDFEFLSDSIFFITTEPGLYYFFIQEDGGTCFLLDEVEVMSFNDILPSPFLFPTIDIFTAFIGQEVYLGAINSNSIDSSYILSWTTDDGNIIAHADSLQPLISSSGTYVLEITHPETGCVVSDEVIVNIIDPVNVFSPIEKKLKVEIIPTVTKDEVRVNYVLEKTTQVSMQIYNVGGVLLEDFDFGKKQKGEHLGSLSLKDFNAGVYFVFVKTEEGSAVRKVVKM